MAGPGLEDYQGIARRTITPLLGPLDRLKPGRDPDRYFDEGFDGPGSHGS